MSLSEVAGSAERARSASAMPLGKRARRWLYIFHRWTGIILCLLFASWFLSGLVILYVSFPSFRAKERVATAAPIDWGQVLTGPDRALHMLGLTKFPEEMRLGMTGGEPVYRFVTDDGRRAVSARTGREIVAVDARRAGVIAATLIGKPVLSVEPIDHDQWVVTRAYKAMAPFWQVRLADSAATDIYVSQRTGEIVQNSTAYERFWNWLGAVPHWIYFEALRLFQGSWRQTVLWTSGLGLLAAMAGFWIGIMRLRIRRRYKTGSVSPYRAWMKWHHVTGLAGGLFLITWVFSGWLSMNPWGGLRDRAPVDVGSRYAGARPDFPATDLKALTDAGPVREVRFAYQGGTPVITLWGAGVRSVRNGRTGERIIFDQRRLVSMAKTAMPEARLAEVERLERADQYWYSAGDPRDEVRPLPVLRIKFDDPARTWLYIDPRTGALLDQQGSGARGYRWLFNGLHTMDFPWLLKWAPLRHILIWALSMAGLLISLSGMVIGWRRLRQR